jgi:hypothetical protein
VKRRKKTSSCLGYLMIMTAAFNQLTTDYDYIYSYSYPRKLSIYVHSVDHAGPPYLVKVRIIAPRCPVFRICIPKTSSKHLENNSLIFYCRYFYQTSDTRISTIRDIAKIVVATLSWDLRYSYIRRLYRFIMNMNYDDTKRAKKIFVTVAPFFERANAQAMCSDDNNTSSSPKSPNASETLSLLLDMLSVVCRT